MKKSKERVELERIRATQPNTSVGKLLSDEEGMTLVEEEMLKLNAEMLRKRPAIAKKIAKNTKAFAKAHEAKKKAKKEWSILDYKPFGKKTLYPCGFTGKPIHDLTQDHWPQYSDIQLQAIIFRYMTYVMWRLYIVDVDTNENYHTGQKPRIKQVYESARDWVDPHQVDGKPMEIPRQKLVQLLNLLLQEFENLC